MALSPSTEEYLNEAKGSLRSALVSASRNERSSTIQAIAEVLSQLDKLSTVEDIMDNLESMKQRWNQKNDLD